MRKSQRVAEVGHRVVRKAVLGLDGGGIHEGLVLEGIYVLAERTRNEVALAGITVGSILAQSDNAAHSLGTCTADMSAENVVDNGLLVAVVTYDAAQILAALQLHHADVGCHAVGGELPHDTADAGGTVGNDFSCRSAGYNIHVCLPDNTAHMGALLVEDYDIGMGSTVVKQKLVGLRTPYDSAYEGLVLQTARLDVYPDVGATLCHGGATGHVADESAHIVVLLTAGRLVEQGDASLGGTLVDGIVAGGALRRVTVAGQ